MDPKIISHFKKVDPVLYKAFISCQNNLGVFEQGVKVKSDSFFEHLCADIVGQQLSGKAADTIYNRFINLLPVKKVTPKTVLKLKDQQLRDAGMSWGKVSFIKDLAAKVDEGEVDLEKLDKMSNEEVISTLTKIKGIGPWTAEMFLMFTLHREDVFSAGDLGLKNGLKKLYNLENPTKEEIEKIVKKWSPFKTYACRVLWKSLEL